MPRPPKKVKGPTEEERSALRVLLYDSQLFGAHGQIVYNVRMAVSQLLTVAGRPDLAAVWDDPEEQAKMFQS